MKNKKVNFLLLPMLALLILVQSCSHFEDLNTDPTTSTESDPQSLISKALVHYSGDRETVWRSTMGYHMAFTQMISDGWAISNGQKYNVLASYPEYMWRSMYSYIDNLQLAIDKASTDEELVNYVAVARILKVLYFAQLTDTYGDIPYFQAVKGYNEGIMWPTYDKQQVIYTDLFKELTEAYAQLDATKALESDLLYSGNVMQWKKFANSLHLRLAMRLVNVDATAAQAEVQKVLANPVIESSADNAIIYHGNFDISSSGATEIRGNAFSQVQHFNDEIVLACATYSDYLRDNQDPRLEMMFGVYGAYVEDATNNVSFKAVTSTSVDVTKEWKASQGNLLGWPAGKFIWDPTEDEGITWSPIFLNKDGKDVQINKYFKGLQVRKQLNRLDLPFIYMSYSEVELLKAEAFERWGIAGDSKTHLDNAIYASIDDLTHILGANAASVGDINNYVNNITTLWATDDHIELINMQQYVNFFFNGIEAFANWRRTGFPKLVPTNDPAYTDQSLNGKIPRRIPYPDSEMQYNRTNLEEHLDNGVNFWGAPVWWDGDADRGIISTK